MRKLKFSEIYSKYYVGIYFIILCIIAIFLNDLFIEAKENGYVNKANLPDGIKEIWYFFITFIFGGFYGANVITLLDKKKRVQGTLILIASLIIAYLYFYIIDNRPVIFVLGLLLTAIIGLKLKTIKIEEKDGVKTENIKYDKAALIASCPAILFVGLTYLNYLLGILIQISNFNIYKIFGYLILTLAFSFVFYKFMKYELRSTNIFVVGPGKSGKTVFLCGCYMQALNNKKLIGFPSTDFFKDIKILNDGIFPDKTFIPREDKLTYESGFLLTKDVVLSAFDYDGNILEDDLKVNRILDYIGRKRKDPKLAPVKDDLVENIADKIYSADKLIFIIDPDRIGNEGYVLNYGRIREAIPKKYYLVITKADEIFDTEEWWSQDYEGLRKKVLIEMKKWNVAVRVMIPRNKKMVIPTFFRVKEGKPFVIDHKFTTLGFDKILEIMGKWEIMAK